jgi:diacylglycerol kinase family enzyme
VFNLPSYACALPVAADARPDDGLLDWIVLERPGRLALARYALAVLRSAHRGRPDVRHGRARHLRITGGPLAPVQLDGDPAGFTPIEIEVLADALAVIVP